MEAENGEVHNSTSSLAHYTNSLYIVIKYSNLWFKENTYTHSQLGIWEAYA